MVRSALILFFSLWHFCASAQYYFTGEVQGFHGDKLQHVTITIKSTGSAFLTGVDGDFSIVSRQAEDTVTFTYDGYEPYTTAIRSTDFLQVLMKVLPSAATPASDRLISTITGPVIPTNPGGNEADMRSGLVENPFVAQPATMSFTGHCGGISHSLIRRFLEMGASVPADAVKIEEMLDYFNWKEEEPHPGELFHCSSAMLSCPWNSGHRLLLLNIRAGKADMTQRPAANIVLVIDASGSMDLPNKLPVIKSAIRPLVHNLRDIDTISLVVYGSGLNVMAGIPGSQKNRIIEAIEQLRPGGPSPGGDGLRLAYRVARHQWIPGGNNRIILMTDGDICNTATVETEMAEYIGQQTREGIYLSCMGVGMEDSTHSELPAFARLGKGNFASIREEEEGEERLLNELTGRGSIADRVSVTAEFDTTLVGGYRLIGWDNKRSALLDTGLKFEGCSVCPAHSMTALFEIVPKKDSAEIGTMARMKIGYCLPAEHTGRSISYACPNRFIAFERADLALKRAVCIALFGMKLRHSGYVGQVGWAEVERMTKESFSGKDYIDKDYLNLVARARKIYENKAGEIAIHE
ncbi:MAG TPA: von Willebrand factor type A domain-containing protein [Puia sp.]|nr:von Willebrand factor type A domain-containing protein [Puia sp.]